MIVNSNFRFAILSQLDRLLRLRRLPAASGVVLWSRSSATMTGWPATASPSRRTAAPTTSASQIFQLMFLSKYYLHQFVILSCGHVVAFLMIFFVWGGWNPGIWRSFILYKPKMQQTQENFFESICFIVRFKLTKHTLGSSITLQSVFRQQNCFSAKSSLTFLTNSSL